MCSEACFFEENRISTMNVPQNSRTEGSKGRFVWLVRQEEEKEEEESGRSRLPSLYPPRSPLPQSRLSSAESFSACLQGGKWYVPFSSLSAPLLLTQPELRFTWGGAGVAKDVCEAKDCTSHSLSTTFL